MLPSFDSRITPPSLDGTSYKYHAYLASCPKDKEIAGKLTQDLQNGRFFIYEDDEKLDANRNIEEGIDLSRRAVFLLTNNYMNFDLKIRQIQVAKENANRTSCDMILVLKFKGVPTESVISLGLDQYTTIDVTDVSDLESLMQIQINLQDTAPLNSELGQNMGKTMAFCQFYGYLSFVLPDLRKRLAGSGIMKGVTENSDGEKNPNDRNMSMKLFIIIPESLKGPPSLEALDPNIKSVKKLEFMGEKGGHQRDYSTPVYKISNPDAQTEQAKELLFMAEVPSILINIYDMIQKGFNISDRQRRLEIRQFLLNLSHLLEKDDNCRDKYKFIFHKDERTSNYQPFGDVLRQHIQEEIWREVKEEAQSPPEIAAKVDQLVQDTDTMKVLQVPLSVRSLEHPLQYYQMAPENRGKALIISNKEFTSTADNELIPREGAERDEEALKALFESLHFQVDLYRNQTARQMIELVSHHASDVVHCDSQAFVCAVMTHGQCGLLYGSDGATVPATMVMEIIGQCAALKGKPKMFFVEACQNAHPSSPGVLQVDEAGDRESLQQRLVPSAADCLVSYSTIPETQAYRDTNNGTLYIQHLCQDITKHCNSLDLEHILKLVADHVKAELQQRMPKQFGGPVPPQLPFYVSTLDKKLAVTRTGEYTTSGKPPGGQGKASSP